MSDILYPKHLSAEQLPLESKILAVADIFDALLATDHPYKKPMSRKMALATLYKMADNGKLDEKICRYIDAATQQNRKI